MSRSTYKDRKYDVRPYDPVWPQEFVRHAAVIRDVFGAAALAIEHVGSTAVPGLSGKPTIDILVLVEDMAIVDALAQPMEAADYRSLGDYISKGAWLFVEEKEHTRLCNIHVFQKDDHHVQEMLKLRDYLRSHPKTVAEYSALKLDLASKYPNDYGQYRKFKDEWMEQLKKQIS